MKSSSRTTQPTLFIGADHAGYALKEALISWLFTLPVTVVDLSPKRIPNDDYPLISREVAVQVAHTPNAKGILICGSGVGVAIAANRHNGIRAFEAFEEETVKLAREHNDANIITLSGWRQNPGQAKKLIELFLNTKASTAARHKRRVIQLG